MTKVLMKPLKRNSIGRISNSSYQMHVRQKSQRQSFMNDGKYVRFIYSDDITIIPQILNS